MTEIDLPLIPVLNKMEDRGVRIDFEKFSAVQKELETKILEIEAEVSNETGININVNSPKQVSWLLFERLGYKPETKTKGKTSYSTDANVLEKLSKLPDLSKWNTININNMKSLFNGCTSLKSFPDISTWNTSKVTDMGSLFYKCSSLTVLPDISGWNTANVKDMSFMFNQCKSLKIMPDISKWNMDKVENKENMFS